MDSLVSLSDVEEHALKILPKVAVDFFSCGANDEVTLKENLEAFKRWRIRPRMLRNVSTLDLSTTILGHPVDLPVCISPTSNHVLAHPESEVATAKGAASMKTIFTMSSVANSSMEDIHCQVPGGLHFFQVYTFGISKKREVALWMMQKAKKNGFKAIVLTVDLAVLGERYCAMKTPSPPSANYRTPLLDELKQPMQGIAPSKPDTKLTYEDIKWFKSQMDLPLILKGILTAEDARLAVECGADGILVSNHGGRQLDTVFATIDILPEVVAAVKGRCEVYMDGGIRHGTDVLKALALGARAVFIGRPVVYGLACGGCDGVKQVLSILKNELSTAMALSGCGNLKDISRDLVVHQEQHWAKL